MNNKAERRIIGHIDDNGNLVKHEPPITRDEWVKVIAIIIGIGALTIALSTLIWYASTPQPIRTMPDTCVLPTQLHTEGDLE